MDLAEHGFKVRSGPIATFAAKADSVVRLPFALRGRLGSF